jgi:hypothetical protein
MISGKSLFKAGPTPKEPLAFEGNPSSEAEFVGNEQYDQRTACNPDGQTGNID